MQFICKKSGFIIFKKSILIFGIAIFVDNNLFLVLLILSNKHSGSHNATVSIKILSVICHVCFSTTDKTVSVIAIDCQILYNK